MSSYLHDMVGTELALRIGGPAYALELRQRVIAERGDALRRLTRFRRTAQSEATRPAEREPEAVAPRRSFETTEQVLAELWDFPRGTFTFAVVQAAKVDPLVVRAAKMGRELAAAHLGIAEPLMGFYKPAVFGAVFRSASDQNGHADLTSGTIGVRADLAPGLASEVAAHEVFHIKHGRAGIGRLDAEDVAQSYGQWVREGLESRGYL